MAGGIGVGPIYYLAVQMAARGVKTTVVIGARTASLVPRLTWPKGTDLRVCTQDGSAGLTGTVLAALTADGAKESHVYTCGPDPMMKAVHEWALAKGNPTWVSKEEIMACGAGACQGCAVEMAEKESHGAPFYKRACVEGPVFSSTELAW